jgi:hypothetical protein
VERRKGETGIQSSQSSTIRKEITIGFCLQALIRGRIIGNDEALAKELSEQGNDSLNDGHPVDIEKGFVLPHPYAFTARQDDTGYWVLC